MRSSADSAVGDAGEHEALDRLHVAREPRDQVAQAAAVEHVHATASGRARRGGGACAAGSARRARWRGSRRRSEISPSAIVKPDVERDDPDERPEVAGDEHLVDDQLEHPDLGGLDRGAERDQHEADRDPPAGTAARRARSGGRSPARGRAAPRRRARPRPRARAARACARARRDGPALRGRLRSVAGQLATTSQSASGCGYRPAGGGVRRGGACARSGSSCACWLRRLAPLDE